ncbi:MATE family efflux transporter [Actibacterium pelagium]|uniref:Multidrug-efflux transporter n=1 Tax=Actibacterium pelagium TaxID=2029103 RepID=A0A917EII9_9RHOB|nr:MATE family efflux transporter [Actibacterium pelagium]GGE39009.1 MATE family efflux transporter [Actibacterium pelagium]
MTHHLSFKDHTKAVLLLGLPLAGSHLAQFSVNVVDVIMMGWYGVDELAAVVLAGTVYFLVFLMGGGFANAVMPMVAEAASAGDITQARRAARMGLWVVTGYCILVLPLFLLAEPILQALGQKPELAMLAAQYLVIMGFQLFPAMWIMVLKGFLSAVEHARAILLLTIATAALNAALNYVLIFGHFGAPELGIKGCALASLIANLIGFAAMMVYAMWPKDLRPYAIFARIWRPDWPAIWSVFSLGLPIGLTMLAEVGLFSAAGFMFGWIGVQDLAAHGIALQIASATFLFHLGLSNAATVRAGRAVGTGDRQGLRDGALAVTVLSVALSVLAAVVFITTPEPFVGLFLDPDDPERDAIILIGAGLLMLAGVFQIVDAGQVIAMGLLRGIKDTKVPMLIAAFSYWGVGLPASYVLGFPMGLGGAGIWWGLVIGLAVAAVLMSWRFWGVKLREERAVQV